jgi:glycosyltransferase involved in cell wall biosynthesis
MKNIGLCMIVKNEARVILRCLESVRPLADYFLIEDTGSTDDTQDIIRNWLDQNRLRSSLARFCPQPIGSLGAVTRKTGYRLRPDNRRGLYSRP